MTDPSAPPAPAGEPGAAIRRYLRALAEVAPGPVDWAAAPPLYKRYPGARRVVLPAAAAPARAAGGLAAVGALLRNTLGLVRLSWLHPLDQDGRPTGGRPQLGAGRPAPSGGALYPIECYLASRPEPEAPAALYHYDAPHHALELVRPGDHRAALTGLLGRDHTGRADAVIAFTAVFWRSMFKYGEFGYRLQCQETGALLAQVLAVAGPLGATAGIHLCFRDTGVDQLLGLDSAREGSLALVTVALPAARREACRAEQQPLPATRAAMALHVAGQAGGGDTGAAGRGLPVPAPPPARGETRRLPATRPVRLADGVAGRYSPRSGFLPVPVAEPALAAILTAAAAGYPGDLPGAGRRPVTLAFHLVLARVDGVPAGAYQYDPAGHMLRRMGGDAAAMDGVGLGPLRPNTRHALRGAAAVLVPAGDPLAGAGQVGDRWYRLQQIEAGVVVHRAALAAAALGLAARIFSDGANDQTDAVLGLRGTRLRSLCFLALGAAAGRGSTVARHLGTSSWSQEVVVRSQ